MSKKNKTIELSPLTSSLLETLVKNQSTELAPRQSIRMSVEEDERAELQKREPPTLVKSILNVLNGPNDSIERLAFESDPTIGHTFASLYEAKLRLIPDGILKRIAIQDDLVATIVQTRCNHISTFGRPRPDRFSTGYVIEPSPGVLDKLDEDQKEDLDERIDQAVKKLYSCGETKGWSDLETMTFPQYLLLSTRNAVVVGRLATEIIWVMGEDGQRKFHSFRPIDAGTIYRATPQKSAAESVRVSARRLLENVAGKRLEPERFQADEYSWVQVIDSRPVQAFTDEECVVHNFYPVPDVELGGYPVTPIDQMIAAVTTHVNITTHNKVYFQNGRASRGMLVIKSDDADQRQVNQVRQQFNSSINGAANSWRLPVFGVGPGDDITWQPIDTGSRDAEYQYLSDQNARVILSAFQMSPEELPGYSYLSRGTNSQALSESNGEYKLEAARDVGIRPLISGFEDFLNSRILPLLDPVLAKLCVIKLVGLDSETPEKESIRLQQDGPVHMDMDSILDRVEKKPIGEVMGGKFPLNPQFQAVLDKYLTVGQIKEFFFGAKGAAQDPQWAYVRDPFWFQNLQIQMQQQQMQAQAQQQQQAPQGAPGGPGAGQGPSGGQQPSGSPEQSQQDQGQQQPQEHMPTEKQKTEASKEASASGQDLTRSIDQAINMLSKSEAQLPPSKRRLLAQHRKTVDKFMASWEDDLKDVTKDIMAVADHHLPKK